MNNTVKIKLVSGKSDQVETVVFTDVIGQDAVKNKLLFYILSNGKDVPLPTLLFSGSHGMGKTYVASVIARNLKRKFVEVNCSTLQSVKDLVENILIKQVSGNKPVTILFDEAHALSNEISTFLLTLLSPNSKGYNLIGYKNLNIEYDMVRINVIFATTHSFKIFKPLINRCEQIYFNPYNEQQILDILRFYLPTINIDQCPNSELSYACRGRARDAYLLSDKIKRYCALNSNNTLTPEGWNDIKRIFEINYMGLNRQEIALLEIIYAHQPISCANIARLMMLNEENIEGEIEIRPRELGLIINTSQGRILSEDGKKYWEKENEKYTSKML